MPAWRRAQLPPRIAANTPRQSPGMTTTGATMTGGGGELAGRPAALAAAPAARAGPGRAPERRKQVPRQAKASRFTTRLLHQQQQVAPGAAPCRTGAQAEGAGGRWRRCAPLRFCGHGRGLRPAACRAAPAPAASPSSSSRFGLASATWRRAISAHSRELARRSASRRANGSRRGWRYRPVRARCRWRRASARSAPRHRRRSGGPAAASSRPGGSASSITSASSAPCGQDRRSRRRCQRQRRARPTASPGTLRGLAGQRGVRRAGCGAERRGRARSSQLRGCSCDGDVDARFEPPAKRARGLGRPIASCPHPWRTLSAIDGAVKELAGLRRAGTNRRARREERMSEREVDAI